MSGRCYTALIRRWGILQGRADEHFFCLFGIDVHSNFRRLMDQFVQLMSDLFKISVIVVSSMNLCVIQIGWSASISMTKMSVIQGMTPEAYQQPFAPSRTLRHQSLPADADVGERSASNR